MVASACSTLPATLASQPWMTSSGLLRYGMQHRGRNANHVCRRPASLTMLQNAVTDTPSGGGMPGAHHDTPALTAGSSAEHASARNRAAAGCNASPPPCPCPGLLATRSSARSALHCVRWLPLPDLAYAAAWLATSWEKAVAQGGQVVASKMADASAQPLWSLRSGGGTAAVLPGLGPKSPGAARRAASHKAPAKALHQAPARMSSSPSSMLVVTLPPPHMAPCCSARMRARRSWHQDRPSGVGQLPSPSAACVAAALANAATRPTHSNPAWGVSAPCSRA